MDPAGSKHPEHSGVGLSNLKAQVGMFYKLELSGAEEEAPGNKDRSSPGQCVQTIFSLLPISGSIFIFLGSASTCPCRLFANFTGNRWPGTNVSFGLRYWLHDPKEVM